MENVLVGSRNHDAPTTDKLFTVSTDDLMQEALEFCDTRLGEHKGSRNLENAYADCNRANAYIRELIGRLRTAERLKPAAEPRCPKCGAQVDERWDCCEVHEQTEQPMSFYDHAFIAAYMALMGNGSYGMDEAVARSHSIAGHLTRNRANKP